MADLRLEGVTKMYDKSFYGARNLSFTIQDKEFTVLVGPSGCGKTTTLRLIAGLETCDSGKIFLDGRCVNDVSPKDRDIAMVFQNYALYPHMSVYDNMAFGLRMRHYPKEKIRARVIEAAEILGIQDLLKRKPRQLSGGQRQRVAVGRAIVRQPKVFLFDEPLSNLDARLRVQMRAELSRLHRRFGATIVYVTHDQVEAMTLGEKIVVLHEGEIQQIAGPAELYKHPKNKFVAGFIGSPPMNFITGCIKKEAKKFIFYNADINLTLDKNFEKFSGQEVVLGMRPTDFSIESGSEIKINVDVIEPLGSELYVHGRCKSIMLSARLPEGAQVHIGEQFIVKIKPEDIYIFDAKTKENLK